MALEDYSLLGTYFSVSTRLGTRGPPSVLIWESRSINGHSDGQFNFGPSPDAGDGRRVA